MESLKPTKHLSISLQHFSNVTSSVLNKNSRHISYENRIHLEYLRVNLIDILIHQSIPLERNTDRMQRNLPLRRNDSSDTLY